MARRKKNSDIRKAMCARFVVAMGELNVGAAQISRLLGYSNPTTINKVLKGDAFVDIERLQEFAKLKTPEGRHIDLNWLITGSHPTQGGKI